MPGEGDTPAGVGQETGPSRYGWGPSKVCATLPRDVYGRLGPAPTTTGFGALRAGSEPDRPHANPLFPVGVVASHCVALPWHGRGREFESHQVHQNVSNTYRPSATQESSPQSPNSHLSMGSHGHRADFDAAHD